MPRKRKNRPCSFGEWLLARLPKEEQVATILAGGIPARTGCQVCGDKTFRNWACCTTHLREWFAWWGLKWDGVESISKVDRQLTAVMRKAGIL